MKVTKEVVKPAVPAKTVIEEDYVLCDVCRQSKGNSGYENEIRWGEKTYDINRTTVCYENGSSFPEGGYKTREIYHICPDCWESVLKPFLASKGATVIEEESD